MMMKFVALALALASASAFAPAPQRVPSSTALHMGAESMEGASAPFGYWDPMGISEYGSDATLAWFRHAELKHGRVAMAATVGWIIQETGITFPGTYNLAGDTFSSLSKSGTDAWSTLSLSGKLQILFTAGMFEFYTETIKPHYMSGGRAGFCGKIWDPIGFTRGVPEATLAVKRQAELNNGRLAMIGAMSFFAASSIDGSVPALPTTW